MKYVPSLSPPTFAPGDRWETGKLTGVRPVTPVQERSLPPLILHRRPRPKTERRHAEGWAEERRTYCRRTRQEPILMELRSGMDRRRHNQRNADPTEHIDEEA